MSGEAIYSLPLFSFVFVMVSKHYCLELDGRYKINRRQHFSLIIKETNRRIGSVMKRENSISTTFEIYIRIITIQLAKSLSGNKI